MRGIVIGLSIAGVILANALAALGAAIERPDLAALLNAAAAVIGLVLATLAIRTRPSGSRS